MVNPGDGEEDEDDEHRPYIPWPCANEQVTPDGQRAESDLQAAEIIRQQEGTDGGDGTVPMWSAILPGATIYYAEEVHRDLPKNKKVLKGTLELIHGGTPDLPTEMSPFDPGWFSFEAPEPVDGPGDFLAHIDRARRRITGSKPPLLTAD